MCIRPVCWNTLLLIPPSQDENLQLHGLVKECRLYTFYICPWLKFSDFNLLCRVLENPIPYLRFGTIEKTVFTYCKLLWVPLLWKHKKLLDLVFAAPLWKITDESLIVALCHWSSVVFLRGGLRTPRFFLNFPLKFVWLTWNIQ